MIAIRIEHAKFVLKGMTSVGTAADKLLERGILGYSADLR